MTDVHEDHTNEKNTNISLGKTQSFILPNWKININFLISISCDHTVDIMELWFLTKQYEKNTTRMILVNKSHKTHRKHCFGPSSLLCP